jgi:hypothetical protein
MRIDFWGEIARRSSEGTLATFVTLAFEGNPIKNEKIRRCNPEIVKHLADEEGRGVWFWTNCINEVEIPLDFCDPAFEGKPIRRSNGDDSRIQSATKYLSTTSPFCFPSI